MTAASLRLFIVLTILSGSGIAALAWTLALGDPQ